MGAKMSLAPVFYTLAQVRFNPIAQMADYVPQLQDRLRRSGYPDFRKEIQQDLAVRRLDEPQPQIQNQQHIRWSFINTQRTEGYLLHPDALVFHTTIYDTFEDFSKKMLNGLELVHEIIELAYIERIGLRYLNSIAGQAEAKVDDYLNPSLLGLSTIIEGALAHNFTETLVQTNNGSLVARTVITEGSLAAPPDLFPLQLELQARFAAPSGRNAVLDIDYFVTERMEFDIRRVGTQLSASHDIITNAFNVSVTQYARKAWA